MFWGNTPAFCRLWRRWLDLKFLQLFSPHRLFLVSIVNKTPSEITQAIQISEFGVTTTRLA